ncbi:hypothetical protein AC578_4204 [Pseudocercospora eumusae]|uniref:Uncharacterized protein n=1 Tax=Pseudocercospora eumusae TaxID=321146 RepID=A0A139HJA4_9PEZI|nr:hypothetical protein AC578_4204 [Pseudocercospora eumusae]
MLCVTVVDLGGLPYNVSNNYRESDNGDCSDALGAECIAALLHGLGNSRSTDMLNQTLVQQLENGSDTSYPYESGQAVFYQTGNLTWYHESTQVLQDIVLPSRINKTAATIASNGSTVPWQSSVLQD